MIESSDSSLTGASQSYDHVSEVEIDETWLNTACRFLWDADAQVNRPQRVKMAFRLFRQYPHTAHFDHLFQHYGELEPATRRYVWRTFRSYLDDDKLVAYPLLQSLEERWFRDSRYVEQIWRQMTLQPHKSKRMRRLLRASGPVPWALKMETYQTLMPEWTLHQAILNSLMCSVKDPAREVFPPEALRIIRLLDIDRDNAEMMWLVQALNALSRG